jgi:hypothetical protein
MADIPFAIVHNFIYVSTLSPMCFELIPQFSGNQGERVQNCRVLTVRIELGNTYDRSDDITLYNRG